MKPKPRKSLLQRIQEEVYVKCPMPGCGSACPGCKGRGKVATEEGVEFLRFLSAEGHKHFFGRFSGEVIEDQLRALERFEQRVRAVRPRWFKNLTLSFWPNNA